MTVLSVIVPTYNEAENIGPLLEALHEMFEGIDAEFVVVDDDSPDGTAKNVAGPKARAIVRKNEKGLATAVVRGIQEAQGTYVAVMDADWQHPTEAVRRLLERAQEKDADVVIGSRYTEGGSEEGFGPIRKLISKGAALIAKVALPPVRKHGCTDPMSGLFLVRKDRIDPSLLRPTGYKILLEILGRHDLARVEEIGYHFHSRREGDSKLGGAVITQYLQHVIALAWAHPENQRILRFGLVGLSGVAVNLGILFTLHDVAGLLDLIAVPIAVEVSIVWNFLLNDRFTFHDRKEGHFLQRLAKFNLVSLLALVVNVATYAGLTRLFGLHYLAAEAIAIVVAFGTNYVGNLNWTYGGVDRFRLRKAIKKRLPWVPFFLLVVGSGFLYFHDLDKPSNMVFDESYYVTVGQQEKNGIWHDPCWDGSEFDPMPLNYEHPPLAKLIIAWSLENWGAYDDIFEGCRAPGENQDYEQWVQAMNTQGNPYAWRGPSAVMGTLTVLFAGLAAGRLFGGPLPAFLAGGFVMMDNLIFVMSRLAVLDIFATAFLVGGVYFATHGNKRGTLLSGLFLGLGFACKYYVAFAGLPVLLINLWAYHRAGHAIRWRRAASVLGAYAGLALGVWILTYIPWWIRWIPDMGIVGAASHFAHVTGAALKWGATGQQENAYLMAPASWFTLQKPMLYFGEWGIGATGKVRYIYSIGNPLLWWAGAMAVLSPWLRPAWLLVRPKGQKGDLRAWWASVGPAGQGLVLASLLALGTYGSFFLLTRDAFLFYMTVVVPTLCIPLAGALSIQFRHGSAFDRALLPLTVALVLAAFVWYYPVAAGTTISEEHYHRIFELLPWIERGR